MKSFVFITGNQHKADYLAKWLGQPIDHQKVDLPELQSLELREVVEHKVRAAYDIVQKPVLVEDVSLQFAQLGRLPGTFIKWFLQDVGVDGLITLASGFADRRATAGIMYAYYDGNELQLFEGKVPGSIATEARGENTFGKGWNSLFIPDGATKTYAEMTDDEVKPFNHRAQAIEKLQVFLHEA